MDLFGYESVECDDKYTFKVDTPVYTPSGRQPHILELMDCEKAKRLIRAIDASSVSDAEKTFLREAAHRHVRFNYAKIADYYAHATPEMQDLMERSALVIIDFDKAIESGFVKLQKNLATQIEIERSKR